MPSFRDMSAVIGALNTHCLTRSKRDDQRARASKPVKQRWWPGRRLRDLGNDPGPTGKGVHTRIPGGLPWHSVAQPCVQIGELAPCNSVTQRRRLPRALVRRSEERFAAFPDCMYTFQRAEERRSIVLLQWRFL